MSATESIAQGAEHTEGVPYSPELAFDFFIINGQRANDVVFDYMELVWGIYFAFYFGLLGINLDRTASFVYSLRLFGFYSVWLWMRANPIFMDVLIFEQLSRCVLAAGMSSLCAQLFKTQELLQTYTVITIGTSYAVDFFDPLLREHGGCMDVLGEPTRWYPKGSWLSCEDWQFAFAIQWGYTASAYIIVALLSCLYYTCFSHNETISRWAKFFAVGMTSASSAIASLKSSVRIIPDGLSTHLDDYMNVVFWGIVATMFIFQECVHRCTTCLSDCCIVRAMACFAAPLFWLESLIKWIEGKVLTREEEEDEEEGLEAPLTPGGMQDKFQIEL